MAARLTDRRKKKILADYLETESYSATAKKNGVCGQTVRRVVEESQEFAEKLRQKKEENTADILAYMEGQRNIVCEIIGKGLEVLNSQEKLAQATPSQITTAIGTLIDKWTIIAKETGEADKDDELSKSLKALAERIYDGPDRAV